MTFTFEEITVQTELGSVTIPACVAKDTQFAFHLMLHWPTSSGPEYDVTHLPTGRAFLCTFTSYQQCERFIALVLPLCSNWNYDMMTIGHRAIRRMRRIIWRLYWQVCQAQEVAL